MKKSKKIILMIPPILSVILFNACGGNDEETTRDVYQNREDCLKDWNDGELCEEMNDSDSNDYRNRSGGGVLFMGRPFWGPQYYPRDRSVLYKGRTITPSTRSTTMTPYRVTSTSSASSRRSVSSPAGKSSTSFGGFGSRSGSGSSGS